MSDIRDLGLGPTVQVPLKDTARRPTRYQVLFIQQPMFKFSGTALLVLPVEVHAFYLLPVLPVLYLVAGSSLAAALLVETW